MTRHLVPSLWRQKVSAVERRGPLMEIGEIQAFIRF